MSVSESGLQTYLKQINEQTLLDAAEERELARRISRGAEAARRFAKGEVTLAEKERLELEGHEARERMIRANLRLVVNIAKTFAHRGMPLADLIEEGNLGLLRGVEGFDPDMGSRFSTYASWWIKQAIKRALINAVQPVHIPAYMVELISRWKQAHNELTESLGRSPTLPEVSKHLQLPERKVRMIKRAVRAFSAPTQSATDEGGGSLFDMMPDQKTPSPDEAAFSEAEASFIGRVLEKCNADPEWDKRADEILRLRYGLEGQDPLTLKQIGKQIGLTRERVRQIETLALRKLYEAMTDDA